MKNKDHLIWSCDLNPPWFHLPYGLKRITYGDQRDDNGDESMDQSFIPSSVVFMKNLISFAPRLKFLSLSRYSFKIYLNQMIFPPTLSHLSIKQLTINQYDWFIYKNTLPRNITHLKIGELRDYYPHKPFIIPSTIQYIDIDHKYIHQVKIIDESEYYSDPLESIEFPLCLKSLTIVSEDLGRNGPNIFPKWLESLNINFDLRDPNILPPH